ncbi:MULTISPECIES: hypothetical protein [Metallosphaera]|uniref:Uncharacterized protein n=3 Tax=Metallosphaera TaxID=41980 RepID=A4YDB0_METS5|nr:MULTISPECIES: hypothetical protein [Metallosphaera]ABP94412.1 hypothetical protein Msed_0235 [Metallosphaera sedula DSM 5348]AIM26399.1 hypothetical protein HA72_0235 [Metallosphaera sedula]AKV73402.1 hypothetical protein MsedA_0245 [Metallosphaera sedula]AKV75646.1 hypothetical protein MsedB_0245 [Metallosphaera sedula]AKV77892.1 hypothetical protein MsedC_0244 [Metallosphaera sedula]
MKSVVGPVILGSSGVFGYFVDLASARMGLELARKLYPDFRVSLVDLSVPEDKILAVDIDPDLGDFDTGYAVLVEA